MCVIYSVTHISSNFGICITRALLSAFSLSQGEIYCTLIDDDRALRDHLLALSAEHNTTE